VTILTTMKSLPMAYNKDMQEDKEPLFDTVDTLKICVEVYTRMLPNIEVHAERMKDSCEHGFLNATDFADYLVNHGMAFRQAHSVAGKAVAFCLGQNKELHGLTLDELKSFSDLINADIFDFISVDQMIARRISYGGTSFDNVKKAIEKAEKEFE